MEKEMLSTVLQVLGQLRILHWQTESFAEHNAFGDTYESLNGHFDSLIEVYSGKNQRPKLGGIKNLAFSDYDNVKVDTFIETTLDYFTNLFPSDQDSELANIRDEIKADLEKLKYLLTLK